MKKIVTLIVILAMIIQVGAVAGASISQKDSVNQNKLNDERLSNDSVPQEVWNETYGGDGEEAFYAMDKTDDGGVVMAGENIPPGTGDSLSGQDKQAGGWLVKLDENGKIQWQKTYYTPNTSSAQFSDVLQINEGGYIAVGSMYSDSGNRYAYVVKTDSKGKELWNKTLRYDGNYPNIQSVTQDSGNYVVAGYANISGAGAWLMKMDENGNTVWTKTYGNGNWGAVGVVKANNGYIAAGNNYTNSDRENFWLKIDKSGKVVWKKPLNTTTSTTIRDLSDVGNGKYAFTGNNYINGNQKVWFGVIDSNGNTQWTNTIGGSSSDDSYEIIKTDKGFAIGGTTYSYGVNSGNEINFWLLAVDENGNERWNTTFGGNDYDSGGPLVKDGDSFYMAGQTQSYDVGGGDGWLVKAAPPKPPKAAFTYSPSSVTPEKKVTFNATSSSDPNNDIVSYEWDFDGDGSTDATGKTVKHTYSKNGTYKVKLTVTDSEGSTDTTTKTIDVTDTLSIEEVIANLNTENDIVNFPELQKAINYWVQNKEVPNTGGKKINFSKLQDLISLWVQEKKV